LGETKSYIFIPKNYNKKVDKYKTTGYNSTHKLMEKETIL